eukprot:403342676
MTYKKYYFLYKFALILILSNILANGKQQPKTPKVVNQGSKTNQKAQKKVHIENTIDKQKIMIFGSFTNSHAYKNIQIATNLQKSGKYDVTILQPHDSLYLDELKDSGVTFYLLTPYGINPNQINQGQIQKRTYGWYDFSQELLFDRNRILQLLKQQNFDMLLHEFNDMNVRFAKLLNAKINVQFLLHYEPWNANQYDNMPMHSALLHQLAVITQGTQRFSSSLEMNLNLNNRLYNHFVEHIYSPYQWFYSSPREIEKRDQLKHHIKNWEHVLYGKNEPDLVLIESVMGVTQINVPLNPHVKFNHMVHTQKTNNLEMSPEIKAFYSKHQNIVYVARGSDYIFREKDLLAMIDLARQTQKDFGYLLSIKKGIPEKLKIPLSQTKNILIQSSVNQLQILDHPQTKIFLTHGGINSVYESIERGKIMIVHPQVANDQQYNCQVIHAMKVGVCLMQGDGKALKSAILDVKQNYQIYQDNINQMSRVMHFERENSDSNFYTEIDQIFEVGKDVWKTSQYTRMNLMEKYDADIHLVLFIMLLLSIFLIYRLMLLVVKRIISKGLVQQTPTPN